MGICCCLRDPQTNSHSKEIAKPSRINARARHQGIDGLVRCSGRAPAPQDKKQLVSGVTKIRKSPQKKGVFRRKHPLVVVSVLITPKTLDSAPMKLYPCGDFGYFGSPRASVKSAVTVCGRIHTVEVVGSNLIAPTIFSSTCRHFRFGSGLL